MIKAQKEAVVREIATKEIQLEFMLGEHKAREEKAKKEKNKEQREAMVENLAKQKMQQIHPIEDDIAYKAKYYDYLCGLSDTQS